jgi:ACT domain-containing protein
MERISTAEAAKELNLNILAIQVLMQQEKLPIGYAIKKQNSTRYTYYIFKELVEGYKKRVEQGELC